MQHERPLRRLHRLPLLVNQVKLQGAPDETGGDFPAEDRRRSFFHQGVVVSQPLAVIVGIGDLRPRVDSLQGRPLYTPTLLGSVLFLGRTVEQVDAVVPTMVFAYTGLHVLLFLLAGLVVAWMVSQFERNPQFGLVLILVFLLFEAVLFGFEVTLVPNLVGALGAGVVALANLLAAVAMFWYLLAQHPGAVRRLRQSWNE